MLVSLQWNLSQHLQWPLRDVVRLFQWLFPLNRRDTDSKIGSQDQTEILYREYGLKIARQKHLKGIPSFNTAQFGF